MGVLDQVRADLIAEHESLDRVLATCSPSDWDAPTPAEGWSVRDQVSHLAFFDEQARSAATDPESFAAGLQEASTDVSAFMNDPIERGRAMSGEEVLAWWHRARSDMIDAFSVLEEARRIPWFGPPMSPASFISARIMETWAHGQDVVDCLGVDRDPTDRLRHVAFLGVKARPYSYIANGLSMPEGDVRVELALPSGENWAVGDSETNSVVGTALDFCLVVTQRRHLSDTDLVIEGELARAWMDIAQCFAGPPGKGRAPGQFERA